MAIFVSVRAMSALFHSALNPLIFDSVTDYFPANQRGRANGILMAANFVGISMCSASIYLISQIGWRNTFKLVGVTGLIISTFIPFILKKIKKNIP